MFISNNFHQVKRKTLDIDTEKQSLHLGTKEMEAWPTYTLFILLYTVVLNQAAGRSFLQYYLI